MAAVRYYFILGKSLYGFNCISFHLPGRRSISAKHNTENGKSVAAPPTITKSYTSTKKEELLQVINKVKQQLENVSAGGQE